MSDTDLLALHGRVALITGAGQGIGAATAQMLATQGARVIVNDVVGSRAQTVAEQIGDNALAAEGDVTDFSDVQRVISLAERTFGTVDILVNNAGNAGTVERGRLTSRPFWEKDPSEWVPFVDVNLYGPLNCARAVLPAMIANGRGGRLITIVSDAARVGQPGLEAYSAAKAGAAGLTRALARSIGRYQITANNIAISATRTPAIETKIADGEWADRALRDYLIRRFGEPDDIAAMVTFLASNAAGWITGQTYPVNGGFSVNQ